MKGLGLKIKYFYFFQIRIKAIHIDRRIVELSCLVILKESTLTHFYFI